MNWYRYFLAAVTVGMVSVIYNFLIFRVLNFYPDLYLERAFFDFPMYILLLYIFVKGFLIGLVLMFFFNKAYFYIRNDKGAVGNTVKGSLYFVLYSVFALFAFTFSDAFLMRSQEGLLVLLTVDGFMETLIATIPIRFFNNDL